MHKKLMDLIQNLPSDILCQVFRKLSKEDLKISISFTCKRWRDVILRFGLLRITVNLNLPFQLQDMLHDFDSNPLFGHTVKNIRMDENYEKDYTELNNDVLQTLVKLCPNLEKLLVWTTGIKGCPKFFYPIIEQLFSMKHQFGTKLKSLILNIPEPDLDLLVMNLDQFLNNVLPSLREFVLHSFGEYRGGKFYAFSVAKNLQNSYVSLITKVIIRNHYIFMTKACVEYIISGSLTNLEFLELRLHVVEELNKFVEPYEENNVGKELWDKVEEFCKSSLKKYRVSFLQYVSGQPVLSTSNYDEVDIRSNYYYKLAKDYPFIEDSDSDY